MWQAELVYSRPAWLMPLVLGVTYSIAAILLASNQYTAVDGALRCLRVYWHRPPLIGPNNHLLYLVNVWLWWHLLRLIGFEARTPLGFLRAIAATNALAAGAALAMVNLLVWRLTQEWKASILAALCYALSWAMLAHATNSAEPMVGLLASLLALLLTIEGLARRRPPLIFAGGLCLALALADYESMFLMAGFIFLLCWLCPYDAVPGRVEWPRPMLNLLASVLGTLLGVLGIYGAAYSSLGLTSADAKLSAFFQAGGEPSVYGGFSLSRLVNLPAGLLGNLVAVLPDDYKGLRQLFSNHYLHDKVVTDFDPVSSMWMSLYDEEPARTLLFPATQAEESLSTLERWSRQCALSRCRILFIALLDQSRETWDGFLAGRLKVPYRSLDHFRQASPETVHFACEPAGLHVYDPGAMRDERGPSGRTR